MTEPIFIDIPGSKSLLNRYLILSSYSQKSHQFLNASFCQDVREMLNCLTSVHRGYQYHGSAGYLSKQNYHQYNLSLHTVYQENPLAHSNIQLQEAGTVYRFLPPLLCLQKNRSFDLNISSKLSSRPLQPLIHTLQLMGADIQYKNNTITINGGFLNSGAFSIESSLSSQFISALLLTAPALNEEMTLVFKEKPVSWSYIQMTAELLKGLGFSISLSDLEVKIHPNKSFNLPEKIEIEPDYSTAVYYLLYSLFSEKQIYIPLINQSMQGDYHFIDLIMKMGCQPHYSKAHQKEWLSLTRNSQWLDGIEADMSDMPDQIMSFALLRLISSDDILIKGYKTLNYKESQRLEVMKEEYQQLGLSVVTDQDRLIIKKSDTIQRPVIFNHHQDHRFALLSLILQKKYKGIETESLQCIRKSSPENLLLTNLI